MVRSPVEICFGGEVAALVEHIPCADLSQPDLANRLIEGFRHENAYMGHASAARELLERAVEAFNASSEEERLAARAAGQDAGVADLALMSWSVWLLGHTDTAITRIVAAIQRADAIDHPHSQAYACYYASDRS
jgi:hypothetical protein